MPLRAARTRETTPTRGGKHPPAVLVLILSWKKKLTTPHRRQHARLNAHVQGWTHSVPNTHSTSTLFQPSLGTLSWRIPLPLPVLVLNYLQGFPLWEMSSPLLPWTHLTVLTWHSQKTEFRLQKNTSLWHLTNSVHWADFYQSRKKFHSNSPWSHHSAQSNTAGRNKPRHLHQSK